MPDPFISSWIAPPVDEPVEDDMRALLAGLEDGDWSEAEFRAHLIYTWARATHNEVVTDHVITLLASIRLSASDLAVYREAQRLAKCVHLQIRPGSLR